MENPIKVLRVKHNMTQAGLAQLAGITPTAVLRYEQGIYENPSESIINAFHTINDNDDDDPFVLPYKYHEYRQWKQKAASKYFKQLPQLAVKPNEHPFVTFRKHVTQQAVGKDSRMSFCILLAIHPSVVLDYEKGKQPHIPALIRSALVNAAVGEAYLKGLDELGEFYYERNR